MKQFDTYKMAVNIVERYHRKYISLYKQIEKTMSTAYVMKLNKQIAALQVDKSWIAQLQKTVSQLSIGMDSPAVELAKSANLSISHMIGRVQLPDDAIRQATRMSQSWREEINRMQKMANSISISEAAVRSHLADISRLTILAQGSLSVIPHAEIGEALNLTTGIRNTLSKSFLDFSLSYTTLFQSFEKSDFGVLISPPKISQLPSIEYFNASDLINVISAENVESELEEQKQQVQNEINDEIEGTLPILLSELDENLIRLWEGARDALDSRNADRVRHFAISLRELFTQVIHRLAPDDYVREWSTSPQDFSRNRPTRRARLLFICRGINHGPFVDFVKKDIAAVLEFTNLFQRGTHEVTAPYTEEQLVALRSRMESMLRFMLEISRLNS